MTDTAIPEAPPDPCACGTPSIVCDCGDNRCPVCDPTCEEA